MGGAAVSGAARFLARGAAVLFVAALAALLPGVALANGGQIRIAGQRFGPYEVTVFTSPTPLQVATADINALVQDPKTSNVVSDARVWVTAELPGHPGVGGTYEATHGQATNKLFYAANFKLPTAGTWHITVKVVGPAGQGQTSFDAAVETFGTFALPRSAGFSLAASWPLWLLVALVIGVGLWWVFSHGGGSEDPGDVEPDI